MLSYYDSLSFSVRKESSLFSFCIALLMFSFLALACYSLDQEYGILNGSILKSLEDPTTRVIILNTVSRKLASICLWMISLYFLLFSFQVVYSKKELFQPTVHSTKSFFLIATAKMMLLCAPILIALHSFFPKLFFYGLSFLLDTGYYQKNVAFNFPFDKDACIWWAGGLFIYFIYAVLLFLGHFSFSSLFNLKLFLRRISVVIELVFHILVSVVWVVLLVVAMNYCCLKFDTLYVCFFALLIYFICTIASSSRWVFMSLFLVVLGMGFALNNYLGYEFFRKYMILFLLIALVYFTFFFIVGAFFSTLAYSFASTAYVFRFNQTPSKDVKQQAPEKLRRIDELYNVYLKEHRNDVQDNFFHHMEE